MNFFSSMPVSISHSHTVLSGDPDARHLPSGLNATLEKPSECPVNDLNSLPVSISHNRTALSVSSIESETELEAMRVPSGLNTALIT